MLFGAQGPFAVQNVLMEDASKAMQSATAALCKEDTQMQVEDTKVEATQVQETQVQDTLAQDSEEEDTLK